MVARDDPKRAKRYCSSSALAESVLTCRNTLQPDLLRSGLLYEIVPARPGQLDGVRVVEIGA